MVLFSLQSMPVQTKIYSERRLQGLTMMQHEAARQCQRFELERIATSGTRH